MAGISGNQVLIPQALTVHIADDASHLMLCIQRSVVMPSSELIMYLLQTARKGISSMQLSKELGITQKSAWFLLHRIREACDIKAERMTGPFEVDETYIGGKEGNKHVKKKLHAGRGIVGKQPVLGIRERKGRLVAMPVDGTDKKTISKELTENIKKGATVYTDEHGAYHDLSNSYDHQRINHSAKEYVNGMAHTNGIKSVWAVLKRGYNGVYHNWSTKHMRRYVNEFVFRFNEGNVRNHTRYALTISSRMRSASGSLMRS